MLDGAAAGVEDVEEFVAVEAGEFLFLGGLLPGRHGGRDDGVRRVRVLLLNCY
jgi:hypothetical protein